MSSAIDLDNTEPASAVSAAQSQDFILGYSQTEIQKAAAYAFAVLAGLGAAGVAAAVRFGVFHVSIGFAAFPPLVIIAAGCIYFAQRVMEAPKAQAAVSNLSLTQRFDAAMQNPNTTFFHILQNFDRQELRRENLISQAHLELLNELEQQAAPHREILFHHKYRHALTFYANQPEKFQALMALDARYKAFLNKPPVVANLTPTAVDNAAPTAQVPAYLEVRVKQAVACAFAALSALGAAIMAAGTYSGAFTVATGLWVGIPLALVAGAILIIASQFTDYKDPATKADLRNKLATTTFVDMYREHGLANLLQVFTAAELKQKFNAEVQNPKTTFWNVLRRYKEREELCAAGIISREHLAVLNSLSRQAAPLNASLFSKNGKHSVAGSFAKKPEEFRQIEALDKAYKAQLVTLLQ